MSATAAQRLPRRRRKGKVYGPSICPSCALFMQLTVETVKSAVDSRLYDRYDTWVEFIPPSSEKREKNHDLLHTPLSKQNNKFSVLDSGLANSHRGMHHDLVDEQRGTYGFGRWLSITLDSLPMTSALGYANNSCYMCAALQPLISTQQGSELPFVLSCEHQYLNRWVTPTGSPFEGAITFHGDSRSIGFHILPFRGRPRNRTEEKPSPSRPSNLRKPRLGDSKEIVKRYDHGASTIPADILTEEGVRFLLENWLRPCLNVHSECPPAALHIELPARLIHVKGLDASLEARLVHTRDLKSRVRYLSVTHAWGTIKFITLSVKNIMQYQERIPLDEPGFNRTFKEAMKITRLLGYEYIWIDSLCIIQDSPQGIDWAAECPRMGIIYQNSELNISASGFGNPELGMLGGQRNLVLPPRVRTADQVEYLIHQQETPSANWPLAKRGWCFQEHILAPRTLHFTSQGSVVWECRSGVFSETFPKHPGVPDMFRESRFQTNYLSHRKRLCDLSLSKHGDDSGDRSLDPSAQPADGCENILLWYRLIYEYATMDLTFETDKLFAIQGLADVIGKTFGFKYLAGHWDHDLPKYLLWRPLASNHPPVYKHHVAPSWSWASVKQTQLHLNMNDDYLERLHDPLPAAEFLDADFLESGELAMSSWHSHCRLRVRGPLYPLWSNPGDCFFQLPPPVRPADWRSIVYGRDAWTPGLPLFFRYESTEMAGSLRILQQDDSMPGFLDSEDESESETEGLTAGRGIEDQDSSRPRKRPIGLEIMIDSHRREEFWQCVHIESHCLYHTPSKSTRGKRAKKGLDKWVYGPNSDNHIIGNLAHSQRENEEKTDLFLLWMTVEEDFDRFPCMLGEPCLGRGLLLKQVALQRGRPVCKRLGIFTSDHFAPPRETRISLSEIEKMLLFGSLSFEELNSKLQEVPGRKLLPLVEKMKNIPRKELYDEQERLAEPELHKKQAEILREAYEKNRDERESIEILKGMGNDIVYLV